MKSKIGISLLACTLILSSSPLPLILADELNDSNTETEMITSDSQTTLPEEDETLTNQEGLKNTQASTQSTTPPPTLPSKSDSVEETVASETPEEEMITQEVYGDYELNELLQQEQRDAAMAMMDSAPTENRSRQKRSAMTYASNPQADFINAVAPGAVALAGKYNLYASVMIAQAILESGWGTSTLSLPPNHNLFGIKGDHNGQSVTMKTWEVVNGQTIWINAKFRKYPNYQASLEDNAKLLRYGPNFSSSYYNGAWKENTKSYQDATAWLTGRYATDPKYANKLNATIAANQLTKYDYPQTNPNNQTVETNIPINKTMKVTSQGYNVYTNPYNTANSFRIGPLKNTYSNGSQVEVTNLATTSQGTKTYHIKNLGWVDYRALKDFATITEQKPLNKTMRIAKTGYFIYSKPFNTEGATKVTQIANKFTVNQEVKVTAEAMTSEGVKVKYIDKVGWVDHQSVKDIATITKKTTVKKTMRIDKTGYFVYNLPYNTNGAKRGKKLAEIYSIGRKVTITAEATTSEGVNVVYIDKLGWVDTKAVGNPYATITKQLSVNKTMKIDKTGYFVYNHPYNTEGAKRGKKLAEIYSVGNKVTITAEATTSEGVNVVYIDKLGWVDIKAVISPFASITEQKPLNKTMRIAKTGYYIYNRPYNTENAKRGVRLSNKYSINQEVKITSEATTSDGVKVKYIDNVGWVDYRAVKDHATLTKQTPLNITMRIAKTGYFIYKQPYNTVGANRVTQVSNKFTLNQEVKVTAEATTSDGVEVKYIDNVGWVDFRAVKDVATIKNEKQLNKTMQIAKSGYYIYKRPYNTIGAERNMRISAKYTIGQKVSVTAEATTSEGTTALYIDKVGWVDYRALK